MEFVFEFEWATPYRVAAAPFLVTPGRARVVVSDGRFEIRFGPWTLSTDRSNIASTEITGDYSLLKTAGPPHLSFADRGITFATNSEQGVCIRFHEAVPAIEPSGRIRHPGATVTVADCDGLIRALAQP